MHASQIATLETVVYQSEKVMTRFDEIGDRIAEMEQIRTRDKQDILSKFDGFKDHVHQMITAQDTKLEEVNQLRDSFDQTNNRIVKVHSILEDRI